MSQKSPIKGYRMAKLYIGGAVAAGVLGLFLSIKENIISRFPTVVNMFGQPAIDLRAAFDKDNVVDILIIGSGPAGLLAAIYGGRAHHDTWVLEGNEPGGLLTKTSLVENWPGEVSIMGQDIINNLKIQAERHGAQFLADSAIRIDFSSYPYVVYTEEGKVLHALSIIIATGATPKKLDIPGEEQFWGKGVTNCAICDAPCFEGLDVIVIGGGDAAVEEALQLAPYAASITIMVRGNAMRAAPSMKARLQGYSNIKVRYNVSLAEIEGDKRGVTHMAVKETTTSVVTKEPISGVFLAIGQIPNTHIFKDQIKLLATGHIALVDVLHRTQKTSVPGVFVAGDVADIRYRQASVAAGDGARASIDADEFLRSIGFNEDTGHLLEDRRLVVYDDMRMQYIQTLASMNDYTAQMKNSGLVCLDFYTESCPSCLHMLPVVGYIAQQYADKVKFFKIDIEQSSDVAAHFGVKNVPTLLLLNNSQVVFQSNKPMTRSELRNALNAVLVNKQ